MTGVLLTQPLRDEHKELIPHIEQLRTIADAVGSLSVASLGQSLDEVYEFLAHHLLVHAAAEERVLYPAVGRLMGAAEATATMSRDHAGISQMIDELASVCSQLSASSVDEKNVRRILYGLYAVVKLHFAKEEEIYLPMLDSSLTTQEAQALFASLEQAATQAKRELE
ncbi:MAG TPA: hemerythrin domain-containing protein [Ktedonobacteraceae bacterium]|nr:hemerythrin domain-containing protein [Ktedonobacteraceae bacterium]